MRGSFAASSSRCVVFALSVLVLPHSDALHSEVLQAVATQPAEIFNAAQERRAVSQREQMCRSFVGHWLARGSVDMRLVCRQAYTEAACAAAEKAIGGEWPEPERAAQQPEAFAAKACQVVEKKLTMRRNLMLAQQVAKTFTPRAKGRHLAVKRRRRDMPDWAKSAPVMWEDPEATEIPYPLDMPPSTWDGPRYTPASMDQLMRWGGTMPPATLPPSMLTTIAPGGATEMSAAASGAPLTTAAPQPSSGFGGAAGPSGAFQPNFNTNSGAGASQHTSGVATTTHAPSQPSFPSSSSGGFQPSFPSSSGADQPAFQPAFQPA